MQTSCKKSPHLWNDLYFNFIKIAAMLGFDLFQGQNLRNLGYSSALLDSLFSFRRKYFSGADVR